MLSVKEATQVAFEYFDDLYADAPVSGVLLEEVEQGKSGDGSPVWHITLGFTDEAERGGGAVAAMTRKPRRYKRFEIDAETGEVKSMKIRSVENA